MPDPANTYPPSEGARAPGRLLLLAAAFAGLFLFLLAAGAAVFGGAFGVDEAILKALRQPDDLQTPIGPEWLTSLAKDVTALGGTPLMTVLALILAGWFVRRRERVSLGMLIAATAGQAIIVQALKALIARPRPDIVPHLVEATSQSFPSGHSASAAAFYLTLAALIAMKTNDAGARRYVFAVAVIMAVLIGASRVYLGVHYPTDVIGGLSFGAASAALVVIAARAMTTP